MERDARRVLIGTRVGVTLDAALGEWRHALGDEHVLVDESVLAAAERATFATAQRIVAIVRPGSREQVQACMRIAAHHGIRMYPVSTGHNWGLGSSVPPQGGSVLMQLARMDRILEFDEELAYVTVEPGVTFGALAEFLAARDSRLGVPFTGASTEGSLIGNALERGIGLWRYGDRARYTCSLEAVLADGSCVRSGPAAFTGAAAGLVCRNGPGPEIDGLFFQSGFGVVTRMTMWLAPVPVDTELCYFAVDDERAIAAVVNCVRELLLQGVFAPVVSIANAYSLLLTSGLRYPWDALRDATPLTPAALRGASSLVGADAWWNAAWAGFAFLGGCSPAHAAALRDLTCAALRDRVDRLAFVGDAEPEILAWNGLRDRAAVLASLRASRPQVWRDGNADAARITYWRKRTPAPERPDPDRDRCGVLFCIPTVPLRGADIGACARMLSETALANAFEPVVSIQAFEERAAYVDAMLVFDRDVPGEDERALACHQTMLDAALAHGWIPHRLATPISRLPPMEPDSAALLGRLKHAADPHRILAPGRYD